MRSRLALLVGLLNSSLQMSRVGQKIGRLTIVEQLIDAYRCICECGRHEVFGRQIFRANYSGRLECEVCAGRPCEICGTWINYKAGRQSLTCSVACRMKRAAQREAKRYQKVKDTEHWRTVRSAYIERQKAQRQADPEFDAKFRAYARLKVARYRENLQSSPQGVEKFEGFKAQSRAWWRRNVRDSPARYAAVLREMNRWYHGLTDEERERIIYEPRRRREKLKKERLGKNISCNSPETGLH